MIPPRLSLQTAALDRVKMNTASPECDRVKFKVLWCFVTSLSVNLSLIGAHSELRAGAKLPFVWFPQSLRYHS